MNKQDANSKQNTSVEELRKMMEERTRLAIANEQAEAEQGSATTRIELDHTALAEAVESIKTALNNFVQVCNEVLPKIDKRITIEVKPSIIKAPSTEAGRAAHQLIRDEIISVLKSVDTSND